VPTQKRADLISQIEAARGSKVVVYVTGDRRRLETRIANDVFPHMREHLLSLANGQRVPQLDLFLYTSGGNTAAGAGLDAFLREFADRLTVLVPFKALSAGTLIALGADSIVMTQLTQLSPVDPSVSSPYNPTAQSPQPGMPGPTLPVSVEDVIGYLDLAKNEARLQSDTALTAVFQDLASKVHPLALGSVYRARAQIQLLVRRFLWRRLGRDADEGEIDRVTGLLTSKLHSHEHIIGRSDAVDELRLPVEDPDPLFDEPVWSLYQEYEKVLELTTPYNPDVFLGEEQQTTRQFARAIIESKNLTHAFMTTREIRRIEMTQPNLPQPITAHQERDTFEGWVRDAAV